VEGSMRRVEKQMYYYTGCLMNCIYLWPMLCLCL
ncbi:hypothetical protein AC249_AIPGENE18761, partial [Exaiptasia diaphana]